MMFNSKEHSMDQKCPTFGFSLLTFSFFSAFSLRNPQHFDMPQLCGLCGYILVQSARYFSLLTFCCTSLLFQHFSRTDPDSWIYNYIKYIGENSNQHEKE